MDKQAILEEIARYTAQPHLEPHEFTVKDYIDTYEKQHGERLSTSQARNRLNKLVEEGALVKRQVFHAGRWCNAYGKPDSARNISGSQ